MSGDKKPWTRENFINLGIFVFGFLATVFMGYVAMTNKDIKAEVTNDFQIKQLEEVNERMFNYNVRLEGVLSEMREMFKEQRDLIEEMDEKNLGKEQFQDFKRDNNQRWNEMNQDMQYLRSLKQMNVLTTPAYSPKEKLQQK